MSWAAVGVAVISMVSSSQQAEAVRNSARLSKQVSDMNAQYAEVDAFNADARGFSEEARYAEVVDGTIAAQKVALAAQNIDVGFGTAGELQKETKLTGFLNTLDIRNQAHAQAMGYKNEASNQRLAGITGQNAASTNASAIQAAGTMNAVGSVASSASGYYRSQNNKTPKAVGT